MAPSNSVTLWASATRNSERTLNEHLLRYSSNLDRGTLKATSELHFAAAKMTRQQILDSIRRDYDETYFFTGVCSSDFSKHTHLRSIVVLGYHMAVTLANMSAIASVQELERWKLMNLTAPLLTHSLALMALIGSRRMYQIWVASCKHGNFA